MRVIFRYSGQLFNDKGGARDSDGCRSGELRPRD